MTFETKFLTSAQMIEARIDDLLPDSQIAAASRFESQLANAMRYGVLNGGKRLRPFLVLEAAALFDVPAAQALNAACALELVHCYSLVHDDLPAMDDDDLRRGQPTVHKKFDEATAILVGDSLLTLAFEILGRDETHSSAGVRGALVLGLARAAGYQGMAGGQALDLEGEGWTSLSMDEILTVQALKTGALIRYSLEAGALLGGANLDERLALKRYGSAIGLAFQIADDLLDVEGDAGKLGKAVGKDADLGKKTVLSHLGVSGARRRLVELEDEAISALDIFGDRAETLRASARFVIKRDR